MLNVSLGAGFSQYDFICRIVLLKEACPKWFFPDTQITSIFDSFPGLIWNGGRVLLGSVPHITEMKNKVSFYNERGIGVYFTFTNNLLTVEHLNDQKGMKVLQEFENPLNAVIVSSSVLEAHIRKHYPKYKIIFSAVKRCLDKEKLMQISQKREYFLLVIPPEFNHDIKFLKKFTHPENVELIVNEYCPAYCPQKEQHYALISRINLGQADIDEEKNLCHRSDAELSTEMFLSRPDIESLFSETKINCLKISLRANGVERNIGFLSEILVKKEYKAAFNIYLKNALPVR